MQNPKDFAVLAPQLDALRARIGRAHLRHRLGLEDEQEARVFRQGTHFFHFENWLGVQPVLRAALAVTGLRARGRRNTVRFQLHERDLVLPRLPAAFDGYTILQLSDPHLDVTDDHAVRLGEFVRELRCDLCVLTGDYRFATRGAWGPAMSALCRLREFLPERVFAVLGNHDSIRMVPGMESNGMRVLLNESVKLERGGEVLHLAGIDDAHYFRAHNLHKAADQIPDGACAILLSHTPEPYKPAAHCGFDAMLCGHTHGGQVCLPGGVPILTDSDAPRAFARREWRYRAMAGYTSVGCGSSVVDARFNCPPEVTLHRLKRGHQ